MKKLFLILTIVATFFISLVPVQSAEAYYVNGYYKSNGTYVDGYYRSRPNAYTYDNYSYSKPTRSNGYGYNKSYYSGRSYNSNYYTPSYNDYNYNYEKSYNYGY